MVEGVEYRFQRTTIARTQVLAEVDTQEVVASVTELPLAFRPLDNHLFLGGRPPVVAAICSVVDCLDVKPQVRGGPNQYWYHYRGTRSVTTLL